MKGSLKVSIFWVAIVTAFLIGIWLENDSSDVYASYVAPVVNFKIPLILVLVLGAGLYQYGNHRRADYEAQIADYEQQVRNGSRALWKYFKDIGEVKVREIVTDVMIAFTKKNNNVLAVQLYEYTIKHLRTHTLYVVHHKYGYVSESSDINAILQSHYRFPKELYKEYIQARIYLREHVLLETNIEYATGFCNKYLGLIKAKGVSDYTEDDAVALALVEVILDLLSALLNGRFWHDLPDEAVQKMGNLKRTGVLKGIEMQSLYTFEYKKVSDKVGRKYMSKALTDTALFDGIPHIMLLTLNPEYLPEELHEQSEELHQLGEEFTVQLQKELKVRYNDLRDALQEGGSS